MRPFDSQLLLVSLVLFAFSNAHAAPTCPELFAQGESHFNVPEKRAEIVRELRAKSVPSFIKEVPTGQLPVVLVNDTTAPKIAGFLNETIGVQMLLQPEDPRSDHGSLRIGGFAIPTAEDPSKMKSTNLQIDWAPTGTRTWKTDSRAELHSTGYAWRDLNELMTKATKNGYSKIAVELTFLTTKEQRADIEYYQRMRRAALIAISSESVYGGPRPWVPNLIADHEIVEDCFDVSRGRKLEPMKDIISQRLKAFGIAHPDEFLRESKTRKFMTAARKILMEADAWNWDTFNHSLIASSDRIQSLGQKLPSPEMKTKSPAEIENFLNTIVAYDAVSSALDVYKNLGIDGDIFPRNNLQNPKLAAVLVYAPMSQAERFNQGTFTSQGKFDHSGWGEDPRGTIPYPDQHPLP